MRSIWVNIQTSLSLSSSCISRSSSGHAGAELRDAGLVGALDRLLERERAQFCGQDLGPPRTVVADRATRLDVSRDVELPLAGEPTVVDHLVDLVIHVLHRAVGELDPGQLIARDALQLLGFDPQLAHVPGVDREPPVLATRLA